MAPPKAEPDKMSLRTSRDDHWSFTKLEAAKAGTANAMAAEKAAKDAAKKAKKKTKK